MLSNIIMFLDVYSDGGELLALEMLIIVGVILLCITVMLYNKYKKTSKEFKDKKKRLKILSTVFGVITFICVIFLLYDYLYALPKAVEKDMESHNPWGTVNGNGKTRDNTIQSSSKRSDQ